ncbi:putative membrane protein [Rhizobium sp. BK529]|uniref:NnrU family protein n=1 Tax=unclassified Rhizobium TaxID=2613769 RepID=UPI0010428E36|nr:MULTISPECIES: NnrU family protein [unclassified Rhizobium]MBB3593783.1 putative membrane protein [Rhizobium sp. BK529]TCR95998.1 putative membrane protein [Rhizobium sp. BK418]
MIQFLSAFTVFLMLHSIPAIPNIRLRIIGSIGKRVYITAYSIASLAALVWLFSAALALDYIPLWELRPWHAAVTFVLAPVGCFLVLAGLMSANPLSISIRSTELADAVVRITRHPVQWGFALWALGHVIANGDLRSLLLFGGLGLFALAGIPMAERRARKYLGNDWDIHAAQTSIWPLVAFVSGVRPKSDAALVAAAVATSALVAWLLLAGGHAMLFGADPISVFG